jgi:hypothetical protein
MEFENQLPFESMKCMASLKPLIFDRGRAGLQAALDSS